MGKRFNGEEIINALKVIKEVCENNFSNDKCKTCPFEVDDVCGVTDLSPCNWKVSEYKKFQALE